MATFKEHVKRAVDLKGSQAKLADAAGCSQQQIAYLLNYASGISAEMAIAIDKATEGEVSRVELRPDLFGQQGAAA